jgi:CubicO group peptidase (beta-lactamase class C family)
MSRPGKFTIALPAAALVLLLAGLAASAARLDLASRANEYLSAETLAGRFSGAALIARDGKALFSRGYGFANAEHEVPNTPQTKFRLGSLTKQFTAMAIMILQERGKLSVQDPVAKYVPDCPDAWRDITLHHVLTHTAGIPNLTTFPDYRQTMMLPSPVTRTVARFKNRPLQFKPGERFQYSNSGYILLGYIIELVSGGSYEDFLRQNIFEPLKMADSGYDHYESVLKHRASGYARADGRMINAPYQDMSIPHGAGALYSTTQDLLRWDQALYTGQLVSQKTIETVFNPNKNNYAYGWMVGKQFGRTEVSHGGQINGFSSFIARYPADKVCVIVLSNFEQTRLRKISLELAAMVFRE